MLFYLDRFKKADGSFDWAESVAIWDGGLAIYGGVIAAVLVCFVLSKKRGFKLGALTDLIVMGFLIGQAVGRWGNFMNRGGLRRGDDAAVADAADHHRGDAGGGASVPVRESVEHGGAAADRLCRRRDAGFDGENTWFYFLWYGIGRFWVEGAADRQPVPVQLTIGGEPIRVSQALSLVMVLVSAFMLLYNIRLHPHKPEELYVNIAAAQKAAEGESADGSAE